MAKSVKYLLRFVKEGFTYTLKYLGYIPLLKVLNSGNIF